MRIIVLSKELKKGRTKENLITWKPPLFDYFKLNFEGSVKYMQQTPTNL